MKKSVMYGFLFLVSVVSVMAPLPEGEGEDCDWEAVACGAWPCDSDEMLEILWDPIMDGPCDTFDERCAYDPGCVCVPNGNTASNTACGQSGNDGCGTSFTGTYCASGSCISGSCCSPMSASQIACGSSVLTCGSWVDGTYCGNPLDSCSGGSCSCASNGNTASNTPCGVDDDDGCGNFFTGTQCTQQGYSCDGFSCSCTPNGNTASNTACGASGNDGCGLSFTGTYCSSGTCSGGSCSCTPDGTAPGDVACGDSYWDGCNSFSGTYCSSGTCSGGSCSACTPHTPPYLMICGSTGDDGCGNTIEGTGCPVGQNCVDGVCFLEEGPCPDPADICTFNSDCASNNCDNGCCTPPCDFVYSNNCDNTDGAGCTRPTGSYNSCDLSSDVACGSETGSCTDVADNDCDGYADCTDSDCPPCSCLYTSQCCSEINPKEYCDDPADCPASFGGGVVDCTVVSVTAGGAQNIGLDTEYHDIKPSCVRDAWHTDDACDCVTAAQCPGGCVWTANEDISGNPQPGYGAIFCLSASISNCNAVGQVGQPCDGAAGDQSGDDVADGFYCSNGYCCAEGYAYISGVCVETAHGCYTNPCGETPLSVGWWSDSNCITVSGYCCRDGNLLGEPHYDYEAATAY